VATRKKITAYQRYAAMFDISFGVALAVADVVKELKALRYNNNEFLSRKAVLVSACWTPPVQRNRTDVESAQRIERSILRQWHKDVSISTGRYAERTRTVTPGYIFPLPAEITPLLERRGSKGAHHRIDASARYIARIKAIDLTGAENMLRQAALGRLDLHSTILKSYEKFAALPEPRPAYNAPTP